MQAKLDALLARVIDRVRAEREQVYCLDDLDRCNLCGKSFDTESFIVDGEVKATPQTMLPNGSSVGQWAYMCIDCFLNRGVGIGWGHGQLYEKTSDNEWLQIAGFPPESNEQIGINR